MRDQLPLNEDAPLRFASDAEAAGFAVVLGQCAADKMLVAEYDRLAGTNLSLSGAPINVAIDLSSGRTEAEMKRFAAFVYDTIWTRLPPESRGKISLGPL